MFYSTTLTVPAGTAENEPATTTLKITKGVIHRVEVEMRSGTDFRVGCRIYHNEYQLFPSNGDGDFKCDGRAVVFDDHVEITRRPYLLEIRGYSPTATYDHDVYVKVGVLSSDIVSPWTGVGTALKKFLQLVGVSK